MKTLFHLPLAWVLAFSAGADEFTRWTTFESVNAFVAAAGAFDPSKSDSNLAPLFTVRELGQPEDPRTGIPIAADKIQSAEVLWSDDGRALVFVTAAPPLDSMRCDVGVLFLVNHRRDRWHIADVRQFATTGKDAGVSAELTSEVGTGYTLGVDGMDPVVTLTKSQGGRGYSRRISASFKVDGLELRRIE